MPGKLATIKDRTTGEEYTEPVILPSQNTSREAERLAQAARNAGAANVEVDDAVGRKIAEDETPKGNTQQADAVNIAKELGKVLRDALQEHGDELQGAYLKNLNTRGVTVRIVYKPDEQGQQTEDEFNFTWDQGKVQLNNGGQMIDLGPIQNRSGRSMIQKDILKDKLSGFLKSHDESSATPSDPANIPDGQPVDEKIGGVSQSGDGNCAYEGVDDQQSYQTDSDGHLWESEECQNAFCDAVAMYRKAKDKESIKALFRACRPFQKGDTIQEKLKGAVDWYNWFTENPPKNTKDQVFLEDDDDEEDKSVEIDAKEAAKYFWKAFEDVENCRSNLSVVINKAYSVNWALDPKFDALLQETLKLLAKMRKFFADDIKPTLDSPISETEQDTLDKIGSYYDEYEDGEEETAAYTPSPEDEDKPVILGGDDKFGPEVGDEVEYDGAHYKLYGFCGYEAVLQNVDDERDFKLVKPLDIGMGVKKQEMKETEYIDPEKLPDDEPTNQEI